MKEPSKLGLVPPSTVLVTGSSGYIGQSLVAELLRVGACALIVCHYRSNESRARLEALVALCGETPRTRCVFARFDLGCDDAAAIGAALTAATPLPIDAVVNCAAWISLKMCDAQPEAAMKINAPIGLLAASAAAAALRPALDGQSLRRRAGARAGRLRRERSDVPAADIWRNEARLRDHPRRAVVRPRSLASSLRRARQRGARADQGTRNVPRLCRQCAASSAKGRCHVLRRRAALLHRARRRRADLRPLLRRAGVADLCSTDSAPWLASLALAPRDCVPRRVPSRHLPIERRRGPLTANCGRTRPEEHDDELNGSGESLWTYGRDG